MTGRFGGPPPGDRDPRQVDQRTRVDQRADARKGGRVTQVAGDQFLGGHHVHHHLRLAAAAPRVVSLPAAPPHLVGRQDRVGELLELLAPGPPPGSGPARPAEAGSEVVVTAVQGPGGIGKTALALEAAHQAVEQGWFGGGALFVDMAGYDPAGPVSAGQAVGVLLRALGVADDHLAATPAEQVDQYRAELARRGQDGQRVLILADSAASADQVAALVPGGRQHRLLVTSRDTLADPALPGARLIELDELAAPAAAQLITTALRLARGDDPRPAADPPAVDRLAELCGRLPLALGIVAAILIGDPGQPVGVLVDHLADERTRLDRVRLPGNDGSTGSAPVRAAFALSHRRLTAPQQQMFALLGLNPGPHVSTEAAVALADRPADHVRPLLAALARAGLLTEAPAGSGTWRMHDLIKLYATELPLQIGGSDAEHTTTADGDDDGDDGGRDAEPGGTGPQKPAAVHRLLRHYLKLADAADDHLRALPGSPVPDRFTGRRDALAWLDAERPNLIAAVALCTTAHPDLTAPLAGCLNRYLHWRRHFDDALTTGRHALTTTRELGDRHGEGQALGNLGIALREVRRFDEAITAHTDAAAICRELGDRHGEGQALNNLGNALREVRRFDGAITAHTDAAAIFRELGDRHGEGQALGNLGIALREVRRFDGAITAHTDAAAIFRELGDRHGEGQALNNLGIALKEVRRFDEAITAHTDAAAIFRELGDRHGEGQALNNLGNALREVRRFDGAITAHTDAAAIFRELGDRHGEGQALGNLGIALREVRRFDGAITAHTDAAAICRELGDRHGEGQALNNLGIALREVRRFDEAITAHTQDLDICRELGDRHGEGQALNNLGIALEEVRRFDEAITAHTDAAAIFRELGDRHGEGAVLNNLGIALREVRRFDEAITAHTQDLDICRELGDRHGENIALNNLRIAKRSKRRSWWRIAFQQRRR
ncbi:ATP-binding protein [Actinomadura parmotrematis]|uniref:Tetratricopeptide repeat protein n=1 Tax=Actinomadura parmotrematis TaxID=2864039 RepID=A0ABS7FQF7_9ACTN|nr:tetratricopeptide repeat protein [Actinomadura parmotrematis]MBW8482617.1 tetratricopeptide repeat protein [Actinomadura parmotrematis]